MSDHPVFATDIDVPMHVLTENDYEGLLDWFQENAGAPFLMGEVNLSFVGVVDPTTVKMRVEAYEVIDAEDGIDTTMTIPADLLAPDRYEDLVDFVQDNYGGAVALKGVEVLDLSPIFQDGGAALAEQGLVQVQVTADFDFGDD